jgi:hypothetical protein
MTGQNIFFLPPTSWAAEAPSGQLALVFFFPAKPSYKESRSARLYPARRKAKRLP